MAVGGLSLALLVLSFFAASCHAVTFSSIQRTLIVTASPTAGQGTWNHSLFFNFPLFPVFWFGDLAPFFLFCKNCKKTGFLWLVLWIEIAVLKAGENQITVTWSHNNTSPSGTDSTYKTVKVKLCYAPISQVDRSWRKTVDDLKKDKSCQFNIVTKPYSASNNTFTYTVERNIPTATYFVRAYAFNSAGEEVAYGQTTDAHKTTNLFDIQGITGRHASLDIASICFSAFSVVSLVGFFFLEKRKAKASQQNWVGENYSGFSFLSWANAG